MADTPDTAPSPAPAPPAPSAEASSRGIFARVFSRAGGYLGRLTVYLGSLAALVAAYWYLIQPYDKTPPGLANWLLLALAGVPLLISLAVEGSFWRQRRRKKMLIDGQARARHFVLGPREAKDHTSFSLPDDAHRTVAEWVRAAPHPVLHLTGLSGVGKSSLVQAWLIPELEGDGSHRVIVLRSFEDPLDDLRGKLIGLWDSPPARVTRADLPMPELLTLAARYLEGKEKRLLIIFDQFEEFFILHTGAESAEPLRGFFAALHAAPPPGLVILLSYRKDHAHALAPLHLPPVSYDPNHNLHVNGYALRPFSIAEARAFYQQSGLQISPERLDLALAEAASYEETRAHIRPIVLNVLGRILATLSTDARAAGRARGLIRSQVREWALSTPLQEDIRPVLEKLVSASGTVSPAHEAVLASAAGPHSARLPAALGDLEACGLLRCLSPEQPAPEQRLWQISHDFLARLLALITEGLNKTFWKTIRPWLAPAALGLWLVGALVVWPHYKERGLLKRQIEAARVFDQLNFSYGMQEQNVFQGKYLDSFTSGSIASPEKWPKFIQALRDYNCKHLGLTLTHTPRLPDGLASVVTLETLLFEDSTGLEQVPNLQGMSQLQWLGLAGCTGLNGTAAFQGLVGLKELNGLSLSGCTGLNSTVQLAGLEKLQSLDLGNCTGLKGAAAFQGLAGLKELTSLALNGCTGLESTVPLAGLVKLKMLNLTQCTGLKDAAAFQPLAELKELSELSLFGCIGLESTDHLAGLEKLKMLNLTQCTGLKTAEAFQGLTGLDCLEELYLSGCTGLRGTQGLLPLLALKRLYLRNCTGLEGSEALQGLTRLDRLEELYLEGCTGLDKNEVAELRRQLPDTCRIFGPDGELVKK